MRKTLAVVLAAAALATAAPAYAVGARIDDNGLWAAITAWFTGAFGDDNGAGIDPNGRGAS